MTAWGTARYMALPFVMELESRAVRIAGICAAPTSIGQRIPQLARNLLDCETGFPRNATHLIHHRDPVFAQAGTDP